MAYEIIWNNNPYDARQVPGNLIPEPSCGSCTFYDGKRCTKDLNDRESCECCDDYEWDEETMNVC